MLQKTSGRSKNVARDLLVDHRLSISIHPPSPEMAMSCRYAARTCARQLRSANPTRAPARILRVSSTQRRYNSTEAATDPKIAGIVDQISQLTLLETADLVSSLKVCNFTLKTN